MKKNAAYSRYHPGSLHSAPKPQIILFRHPLETAIIKTSAVIRT